jgi:hypothetical protein
MQEAQDREGRGHRVPCAVSPMISTFASELFLKSLPLLEGKAALLPRNRECPHYLVSRDDCARAYPSDCSRRSRLQGKV